jgi:hypothetical protein
MIVHRQAVSFSGEYYPSCSPSNMTAIVDAQEAFSSYLRTAVHGSSGGGEGLPGATAPCQQPCRVSLLRLSTYAEPYLIAEAEKVLVLRMPAIIQLTESTFSYTFVDFASEFGGTCSVGAPKLRNQKIRFFFFSN